MMPKNNVTDNRIYFFDNIRYLMVLLVVVLHSAASYSSLKPVVLVRDQYSEFFNILMLFLSVFLMPTLFFIAGYFALPSLKSKNTYSFIFSKLRRLGIPFLIGVILYGPIHTYIFQYVRGYMSLGLWNHLLIKMKSALTFHTGFITSHFQFHLSYFWFISLLLSFFIIFALLHKVKEKLFVKAFSAGRTEITSSSSILFVILLTGILITVSSILIHGYFFRDLNRLPWMIIVNLIQFQPSIIGLYGLSFSLGIYAFHKSWFVNRNVPGHFIMWAILSGILWYFERKLMIIILAGDATPQIFVINSFLRTFLFFFILLTLISFSVKYWNSSSKVNRLLASNSYTIYLIHVIFVRLSQLALYKLWNGSIYVKFILVCIFSMSMSLLFSQFVIRKSPPVSAAGLVGVFILLLILLGPS